MATKVEELRQSASSAWDEYSVEMAKYSEENLPTEEQAKHIDELREKATGAQRDLRSAEQFAKDKAEWQVQEEQMRQARGKAPLIDRIEDGTQPKARRSIGTRFVENPAFKDWLEMVAPNGNFPKDVRVQSSPALQVEGFRDLDMHAALLTGDSATSAGAMVVPTRYPGITELGRRPLTMRDAITNLQTQSDTVEYVRITAETNNAAPVAEATATGGGSGAKPESGMTFEKVTTNVVTIAHWMAATRRALSDASQLRGLIDAFLRYGLDEELEDQIAQGDGTGENFTGILNTSGTQAQAWDTNVHTTTRKAKRKVRTVGRRIPNAFILNPEDWEIIDLTKDNNARYYGDGPFGVTPPRLWGLPVIESEAVPVGTGLVGDFTTCVLWDREQTNILVSDSHQDFFTRNLIAILAELRAAFGVLKPNAIVEIDLTA